MTISPRYRRRDPAGESASHAIGHDVATCTGQMALPCFRSISRRPCAAIQRRGPQRARSGHARLERAGGRDAIGRVRQCWSGRGARPTEYSASSLAGMSFSSVFIRVYGAQL